MNEISRSALLVIKNTRRTLRLGLLLLLAGSMLSVGCRPKVSKSPSASKVGETSVQAAKSVDESSGQVPDAEVADAESQPDDSSPPDELVNAETTPPASRGLPVDATSGTWTTQRLVALGPGGPVVIDFRVSIGGQSLADASRSITESLAEELFEGLEEPVTWKQLLELPLVQSGWLGNLVAEADQVEQLIGMYDAERDDQVSLDELEAFLSRGLARRGPLQVRDIGTAPTTRVGESPWGAIDGNRDLSLDRNELQALPKVLAMLDVNGDAVVTSQEVQGDAAMQPQANSSMVDIQTLLVADLDADMDEEGQANARQKLARDVRGQYTFLDDVPRDQWKAWPDDRWRLLDRDEDELLTKGELLGMAEIPADCELIVRFPSLVAEPEEQVQVWVKPNQASGQHTDWVPNQNGGQLLSGSLVLEIRTEDTFSVAGKSRLLQSLDLALRDANLRQFFRSRLQLQEDAFDLIDVDQDQRLSEEELVRVWRWLTARQGTRLLARWMTSARPWFQLIDYDADMRLTEAEVRRAMEQLFQLDQDQDALLTPYELPLLVRLEVQRSDNRLDMGEIGLPNSEVEQTPVDLDWFSAMDTNRDGMISGLEFLGGKDVFTSLDTNQDGFVDREEAP